MAEKFHTELDKLKQDTIELVHLARQMLSDAVDALNVQDCTKAKSRQAGILMRPCLIVSGQGKNEAAA